MYVIENGTVYYIFQIGTNTVKQYYGRETEPKIISETETEKTYQWHKFNLEKGQYEPIVSNEIMLIDGVEYTPIDGMVTINK